MNELNHVFFTCHITLSDCIKTMYEVRKIDIAIKIKSCIKLKINNQIIKNKFNSCYWASLCLIHAYLNKRDKQGHYDQNYNAVLLIRVLP